MASQSAAHVRMRVINPQAPVSSIANARLAEIKLALDAAARRLQ